MSVINITITENSIQTTPGIPDTIVLTTNEPATIFYTLDGSVPNVYSPVFVAPILMPQNLLTVNLNIFATNGMDSSAVITKTYNIDVAKVQTTAGDRLPRSAVSDLGNAKNNNDLYPFGINAPAPNAKYLNTADAGQTVYDQSKPATSTGFDGNEQPAGYSNAALDPFESIYSTTTFNGKTNPSIGNLPAKTTVIGKLYPIEYTPEFSSTSNKIFNPRALVIYQDVATEDPTNPVIINRSEFSLQPLEIVSDGNLLSVPALDCPTTTGTFIKSYYNPRTQEMTSYFYDNSVNRWIISKAPYQPTNNVNDLSQMVFARGQGTGLVFQWVRDMYRTLF